MSELVGASAYCVRACVGGGVHEVVQMKVGL